MLSPFCSQRVPLQLSRHVSAGPRPQPAGSSERGLPEPPRHGAGGRAAAGRGIRSAAAGELRRHPAAGRGRAGAGSCGELRPAPPRSRPPSAGGGRSGRGRGRVFCGAAGVSRPGVAPRRESACPPRGWSLGSARLGPRLLLPLPAAEPSSGKGGAGSPLHSSQSRVSENQPGSGPGPSPAPEGPSGPGPHRAVGPGASTAVAAGQGSPPSRRLPAEPGRLLAPSPPRRRARQCRGLRRVRWPLPGPPGSRAEGLACGVPGAGCPAARPSSAGKPLPSSLSLQGGGRRGLRGSSPQADAAAGMGDVPLRAARRGLSPLCLLRSAPSVPK